MLTGCGEPKHEPQATSDPHPVTPATHPALTGRLVDEAGQPPVLAHARLLDRDGRLVLEVAAGADGRFAVPLDRALDDLATISFSAVDHAAASIVVATHEQPLELTLSLPTYAVAAPAKLEVIFFAPGSTKRRLTAPLVQQADGSYLAEVELPDGKHRYEISGLVSNHTVNGTMSESYEYDGGGDYESVITVSGGKARIVFDPARRPKPGVGMRVAFGNPTGVSAKVNGVLSSLRALHDDSDAKLAAAMAAHAASGASGGVTFEPPDATEYRRATMEVVRTAGDPIVQRVASVAYFGFGIFDKASDQEKATARWVIDHVMPTDPLWSITGALSNVIATAGGEAANQRYVTAFLDQHPDVEMVSEYLRDQIYQSATDRDRARGLVKQLRNPRFAKTAAAKMADYLDPDRVTTAGKQVPAFEVPALVDGKVSATQTWSSRSYPGDVYLVDVWATWCKPCVAEMPNLHALYAKYGKKPGKKLRMLSISIDESPDAVAGFRKAPHPMPWDHGFAGAATDTPFYKALGLGGIAIPFYLLVDSKGTIVDASPSFNVSTLPATLDKLLR